MQRMNVPTGCELQPPWGRTGNAKSMAGVLVGTTDYDLKTAALDRSCVYVRKRSITSEVVRENKIFLSLGYGTTDVHKGVRTLRIPLRLLLGRDCTTTASVAASVFAPTAVS